MKTLSSHYKTTLWIIIGAIAVLISVVFGISRCSHSSSDTYEPIAENDKGYIGKADALFAKLLSENTVENINARSLPDLNRKYPAFVFDVPDSLNSDLNINDIRLVGIRENFIKEDDRNFYESSDLRNLIKQQRLNKDKAIFKIGIKKENGYLTINSIKMIRSLHKIKFSTSIWEGDILAQFYNPINEDNSRFLIYGSSVLPVRLQENVLVTNNDIDAYTVFLLDDNEHGKGLFQQSGRRFIEFDLYRHYNAHYKSDNCFRLEFEDKDEQNTQSILMQVLSDSLIFDFDATLTVTCIAKNTQTKLITEAGAQEGRRGFHYSPDSESIRIMVETNNGHKLAEFQITKHNPLKKLAYVIETNKGKTRKQIDHKYTDVFTQQVVDNFLKNANEKVVPDSISLSIDPILSQALEKELEQYGRTFTSAGLANNEHFEISICLVNTATGEIMAAPYYNYTTAPLTPERKIAKRNPNMIRRYIGSCFKPVMTLASTQLYPELINLTTGTGSNRTQAPIITNETYMKNGAEYTYYNTDIVGCPFFHTYCAATEGNRSHYTNARNLETYLASSNDVYPVVLAMYSFTKFPDFNPLTVAPTNLRAYIERENRNSSSSKSLLHPINNFRYKGNNFANTINFQGNKGGFDIHKSDFAKVLGTLYSIKSEAVINTDSIDPVPARYLLRYLNDSISFDEISPDYTNMDYYGWNKEQFQVFRHTVVPWVLGQGTNEWSPLKLAEAWARMVTKFPVRLSYIHNENPADIYAGSILYQQTNNLLNNRGGNRLQTWNTFLDNFKAAQSNTQVGTSNTLIAMYNAVQRVNTIQHREGNNRLIVLGKTGTPDNFGDRSDYEHFDISGKIMYDIGLYSFSLMTERQYQQLQHNTANPTETVPNAGITAVIRIVHSYPKDGGHQIPNIGSNNARDFFSTERLQKILFYTDKLFR
jgi:hypothetical protein